MSDSAAREFGRKSAGLPTWATAVLLAVLAVGAAVWLDIIEFDPLVVAGLALLVIAIAAVASAVEIVEAYEKRALTVFGEFRELLEPGLHVVPPFVSRTYPFDMRTQTIDVPRQEAITQDNSPVTADAVVYIRVMDAKRAFLEVEDYERATSNLAQTTLRAALGDMELDETLSNRARINTRIRRELEGPTDEWGVRVEAVEVREVNPSPKVQGAMEQQTAAERRRRAMILEAQGNRRSAIERAEGDKTANILEAQGEKQAQILEAQGDAISTVLRAKSAESMGERAIVERGMETLERIGTGESTTFVLPQEMTSLLSRYGRHLSGSVDDRGTALESLDFDAETRELLGIDDIDELAAGDGDVEYDIESADVESADIESEDLEMDESVESN
ncbi:phosphoesterase [Natronomonas sp. CBA1123]|jgi:regulator of protease activity HflC (stomatin/prohibitin superfamily)|uniref:SPFH domain-containing protein n=1 Tax=Natronomonas sp. CBA1123 TaxID=2668070 RepID=UPI0012EAEE65|nr:phosphoesterase [Natronomonas sp. CBA1123]